MIPLEQVQQADLSSIRSIYQQLYPMPISMRTGNYQARFIGPWWLRTLAPISLWLTGLPGWWGKRFIHEAEATNILMNKCGRTEKMSMHCIEDCSLIDGKPTLSLQYGGQARLPWRWVVDEIRVLDDNTLLCMTVVNLPLLKYLSFPFLLSREL